MRKILLIANPKAGNNRALDVAKKAIQFFQQKDISCQLEETSATQNAQKVAEQRLTDEHTDLVVIGGDGTINEAVNGMDSHQATLSILSGGTGNDFIKNIDIGRNLEEQLNTVLNGQTLEIDLGLCNGRKFLNGVGIGFDGQIVRDMLHRKTWLTGHAAYYYHVLRILASYKERSFDFLLDGTESKKDLILMTIGNGTTFGGGFKLTPDAKLDDGYLDICLIGPISAARRFLNVPRLSNGTHLKLKEIEAVRMKTLKVEENTLLEGHIDGEYLGKPPFSISLLPKALKVRVR